MPPLLILLLILLAQVICLILIGDLKMKLSEVAPALTALIAKVEKVRLEVQNLKDSLSDVDLPQDAVDALAALDTALAGVDDINPDAA